MSSLFTSELKEGMITLSDTYSTQGKLILPKDTILTKALINKLIQNDVLFVDASEELPQDEGSVLTSYAVDEDIITSRPEYKKFKRRYEKNVNDMNEHLNDIVYKNAPIDVDMMLKDTLNIVKSTDSPLAIFNMLSTLKNYDDSTFNHSLNVALICNIFSTWLGLKPEETELLTICGIFHDIGKLLIPDKIIQKPGKLTKEEFAIIKTHPQKGYEILRKQKVDLHVQYAALMHHEKCDGSGYPLGLTDKQIDWCAQIVTIADIYEAMTAKRVYREPLSPFTVIDHFEQDGLRKYNPKLLLTFLEHVVNSYMNCKVRLSNGEEGDIVYINKVRLSKPMVKTKDNFIDLSKTSNVDIERIL
ncbi:MAG: HD-GYP domain-containing protein [Wujia sp.]